MAIDTVSPDADGNGEGSAPKDKSVPDLQKLADQLHQALENAAPEQLFQLFESLHDRQAPDSSTEMNAVKYMLGQFRNYYYRKKSEPKKNTTGK